MSATASQITSFTINYWTVYLRRRSKKASKLRVTGLCEGQWRRKYFHLMTSSWRENKSLESNKNWRYRFCNKSYQSRTHTFWDMMYRLVFMPSHAILMVWCNTVQTWTKVLVWLVKYQVWPRKEWEFHSSYRGKFWIKFIQRHATDNYLTCLYHRYRHSCF